MKTSHVLGLTFIVVALACISVAGLLAQHKPTTKQDPASHEGHPALTVAVTTLQPATFETLVSANGNIHAWQEAIIGTEADGLRLVEISVNVGDRVNRGQVMARFAADTIKAALAYNHATTAEAKEALVEAAANGRRARVLQQSGALSAQQVQQYLSAERMAQARLDSAKAMLRTQQLRLAQTQVLAPDDGVISARAASLGAVLPAGEELFRLIRGGRIEWRAEVSAVDLRRLQPGQRAKVTMAGGDTLEGRLRILAPVVDVQTRNGLAYVDLPSSDAVRVGMYARGEFDLGSRQVLTLPQSALQLRDGFGYVLRVGADSRVTQVKVRVGSRSGDQVEIIDGLAPEDRVVVSGIAFLGDGDLIRVAEAISASRIEAKPAHVITQSREDAL